MNKRASIAFAMSLILPVVAFVVIAMRLFGSDRWLVAALLYGGGWTCLIFAAALHRKSRELLGIGKEKLSDYVKANSQFIAAVMVLIFLAYLAVVLFPVDQSEFASATRNELTQKVDDSSRSSTSTSISTRSTTFSILA